MLSKCANPACDAKFQYLQSGKVYVVRHQAIRENKVTLDFSEEPDRTVYVWLCNACSRSMTVQASSNGNIRVVPHSKV